MILISTTAEFEEFVTRLKDKFGFRRGVRCKIRDEDGDGMISLSDQEDLDMAISTSKKAARRDRAEYGKMEVCFPASPNNSMLKFFFYIFFLFRRHHACYLMYMLTITPDLGSGSSVMSDSFSSIF